MRPLCLCLLALLLPCFSTWAEPQFSSIDEQLAYLANLSEAELAKYDIAYLNLVCAQGLNGSENLDIPACLRVLDEMAFFVRANTEANLQLFTRNPGEYDNSEGQFRALCMVTFAVKGYGIQYNPERIESPDNLSSDEVFFRDSRDVFLHGLLQRQPRMGTCSSLPVFWTALGRRLDYPLYMSNTLLHFFTRWEDTEGTFNFEGSQNGCAIYDDAHYRSFPIKVDDVKIQYFALLQSFSRKRELMHFLITRGACLRANGRTEEATRAYELAVICYPSPFSQTALKLAKETNE
ncbi:MAG: hypothetical protein JW942_06400 [Opitutales bacterium]|nr:hypothetical protein [Opitutales bacterium]